jgi:hypothetical protein
MMNTDTMVVEILEDGTIKVTTDPISAANHANAEQFLQFVARMAGGEATRVKRRDAHTHVQAITRVIGRNGGTQ